MTRRTLFAAVAGVFGAKAVPTTTRRGIHFHGAPTATAAILAFNNGARVTGGVSRFVSIRHMPIPSHVLTATLMREEMRLNAAVLSYKWTVNPES